MILDWLWTRQRLIVTGTVQGVGFRPFVYRLAEHFGFTGYVQNTRTGVIIEIEGEARLMDAFFDTLRCEAPPLAQIDSIRTERVDLRGEETFTIRDSKDGPDGIAYVPADAAVCADCLREMHDPHDRRYRYPFINCTHCGPRFTIIEALPYDRPYTTMAGFTLCPDCAREYADPSDRRYHAQPVACPECGPQLWLEWDGIRRAEGDDALLRTVELLKAGRVAAIKGIGGFHLACDATNEAAVSLLRRRKHRPHKPLAIMARDLDAASSVACIDGMAVEALTATDRPIVLLPKRADGPLAESVAPGLDVVGVMLPYAPLHHLLLEDMPLLVMTSGNRSGEPIITGNGAARESLGDLADALLMHDRPILQPCDDSVRRIVDSKPVWIRRSRGTAPEPVTLPHEVVPTLAVGGDLKNTFCLASGRTAYLSQHIGDLGSWETEQALSRAVDHFIRIFGVEPERIVCDLHPGYRGTAWAEREAAGRHSLSSVLLAVVAAPSGRLPLLRVQHHQAHVAGLLAEHGLPLDAPVLGICFDGTGYGSDGAIWGGEFLLTGGDEMERVAHLRYQPLAGGDSAVRNPARIALGMLWQAGLAWDDRLPPVAAIPEAVRLMLKRQLESGIGVVQTSSIGRLFDAVASISGVRHAISYEAQAAMEFEALLDASTDDAYLFSVSDTGEIDPAPVLAAVVNDSLDGVPAPVISARFHHALANVTVQAAQQARARTGVSVAGLTGGVFQNAALLRLTVKALEAAHFGVLTHRAVPANDGGLALGQVWLADHECERA